VTFKLKGEDEERAKAGAFLVKAFGAALFLIFAILLAQFNKFTSVFITLSAVILSTIGVLIGLMVMRQSFGVVMTGIGIIANAGVIVNNNIVLIDTYDRLRREGWAARDAILETCRERARPVVLTAVTGRARRARHRVRHQYRFRDPRGRYRGAVHPMVGAPLGRHRVRPQLCDDPDACRHARDADGSREPRGLAQEPQGAAHGRCRCAGRHAGHAGGVARQPSSQRRG
jgi:hypothetical protein